MKRLHLCSDPYLYFLTTNCFRNSPKFKKYMKKYCILCFFFLYLYGALNWVFLSLIIQFNFSYITPPPKKKENCYSVEFFVLSSVRRQSELRNLLGTALCSSQC